MLRENERQNGLDIRLKPSLGLEGVVLGPDGTPVSGARLMAKRGEEDTWLSANARSDEQGKFHLRGLAPGTWDLTVTAGGFSPKLQKGVEISETPGKPLEITLERGTAVSVRVTESDGRPALGVSARLVPVEEGVAVDPEAFFGAFFGGRNATNSEGLLELGRFHPGAYHLSGQTGLQQEVLAFLGDTGPWASATALLVFPQLALVAAILLLELREFPLTEDL